MEIKEKLILKKSCILTFNNITISRLLRSKYSTVWTKRYNLKKVQHDPYLLGLWTLLLEALLCFLAVVRILARDSLIRTLILADEDVLTTTKIPHVKGPKKHKSPHWF